MVNKIAWIPLCELDTPGKDSRAAAKGFREGTCPDYTRQGACQPQPDPKLPGRKVGSEYPVEPRVPLGKSGVVLKSSCREWVRSQAFRQHP